MVGLVIVSHSKSLAVALEGLARQMVSTQVPIATAAGIGPDRTEFGTDAVQISEAIESVYGDSGVLVLMDLGSAILSAQMAMELLPSEYQENVIFCAAPLVEGALAAIVQISLGADLQSICREARQALLPKQQMIGQTDLSSEAAAVAEAVGESENFVDLTLHNVHGLHARPAAKFVQEAGRFDARITVRNLTSGKGPVPADSFNALATLGALAGHTIRVAASGPEAGAAVEALRDLSEANFGEPEAGPIEPVPVPRPALAPADSDMVGVPISSGIAVGPLFRFRTAPLEIPTHPCEDSAAAWARLNAAIELVDQAIGLRRRQIAAQLGEDKAAIFDAHRLILHDPALSADVRKRIFEASENEIAAWDAAVRTAAGGFAALEDVYLQQRAADVMDVGGQVLRALSREIVERIHLDAPVVLLAEDLTPTQTAQLEMRNILGLLTRSGGPTSHSAILARSFGIPAVTGLPGHLFEVPENTLVALDGQTGAVWINPGPERQVLLQEAQHELQRKRERLLASGKTPGITKDGTVVEIAANCGSAEEARAALQFGADGIGLLRTEFLFLTRKTAPTEEDQYQALRAIAVLMGEYPVTIRTLDVGGDKPLPYIDQPPEANPFLGIRAIRLSLQRPDLFTTQLRAILRAGAGHRFRIMFPMVANLDEWMRAKRALEEAHMALADEGVPHAWPLETGIMVEIPAAALTAHLFAPHVDFFSVGTNDLTQYTLAAERGNPDLSNLTGGIHPAVLRLVRATVEAANIHGKWVGVCGEMAGDPAAIGLLLGLGVRELSMSPAGIPAVKAVLQDMWIADAENIAARALQAASAEEVRALLD